MSIGPVVFTVQGDQFIVPAHLSGVIWEGAMVSGDTVELRERSTNALLWACRTDVQQTYLGATFGAHGVSAPGGFKATILTAGRLLVYLKEA